MSLSNVLLRTSLPALCLLFLPMSFAAEKSDSLIAKLQLTAHTTSITVKSIYPDGPTTPSCEDFIDGKDINCPVSDPSCNDTIHPTCLLPSGEIVFK